jgi:hypothetical protein
MKEPKACGFFEGELGIASFCFDQGFDRFLKIDIFTIDGCQSQQRGNRKKLE